MPVRKTFGINSISISDLSSVSCASGMPVVSHACHTVFSSDISNIRIVFVSFSFGDVLIKTSVTLSSDSFDTSILNIVAVLCDEHFECK